MVRLGFPTHYIARSTSKFTPKINKKTCFHYFHLHTSRVLLHTSSLSNIPCSVRQKIHFFSAHVPTSRDLLLSHRFRPGFAYFHCIQSSHRAIYCIQIKCCKAEAENKKKPKKFQNKSLHPAIYCGYIQVWLNPGYHYGTSSLYRPIYCTLPISQAQLPLNQTITNTLHFLQDHIHI